MGEASIIDIIRPGTTRALDFIVLEELQKRTGIIPREILKFALAELLCNALDKAAERGSPKMKLGERI